MRRREIVAGLRRLAVTLAGTAAVTAVVSLVLGLLLHAELRRALAIGFYLAGSVFVAVGFFYGTRPPVRTTGQGGGPSLLGSAAAAGGTARWADRRDLDDSFSSSVLFVVMGVALVVVGALFDPRDGLL